MLHITTILFLIAGSILAVTHILAMELYLYWQFWWLDIPVHLLGGVVAGLGLFVLQDLRVFPRSHVFGWGVLCAYMVVVVVVWEVFELAIGRPVLEDFWTDTTIDVIMGLGGGLVAGVIGRRMNTLSQL